MYCNPFTEKLSACDGDIERLASRRTLLLGQLSWAAEFKLEEEVDEIARIRSDLEDRTVQCEGLEQEISKLQDEDHDLLSKTSGIEADTSLGLSVHRWFTAEHRLARVRLAKHEQDVARLRKSIRAVEQQRQKMASAIDELTDHIVDKEMALERYRGFRPVEVAEEVAAIDEEVGLLKANREYLVVRSSEVDRAVEAPLEELLKYESGVADQESELASINSELSRLQRQIADAESIDEQLSRAADGAARYKLHQECERQFRTGSPRQAIKDLRSQVRPRSLRAKQIEGQIARDMRDMAKAKERIAQLAEVAAREIDTVIIDGNNCCYEGDDFIGLAALQEMIETLAAKYTVAVVFDSDIRNLLGLSDGDLRSALSAAKVHVVAPDVKADETILDAAGEPTTWVISNDRFGDYRDKASVREHRVIRHEILLGRVLVRDLGVNSAFRVPGGA